MPTWLFSVLVLGGGAVFWTLVTLLVLRWLWP
jgi:hypothetical protein